MNTYRIKGHYTDRRLRPYYWECVVQAANVSTAEHKALLANSPTSLDYMHQEITSCEPIYEQRPPWAEHGWTPRTQKPTQPEKQMKSEQLKQKIRDAQVSLEVLQGELQEALQAEKKWELPGGTYYAKADGGWFNTGHREDASQAQTKEEAQRLAQHLKNSAILWHLANDLNPDGWKPNWEALGEYAPSVYGVYFCPLSDKWRSHSLRHSNLGTPVFKNSLIAQEAAEILNNQVEELGVKL